MGDCCILVISIWPYLNFEVHLCDLELTVVLVGARLGIKTTQGCLFPCSKTDHNEERDSLI